uniref:Alkylglycerone-phosphate synthase n=1 Tax=Trichogramma kaykai TaxID=54128 RepID=A0ABD2X8K5_9HYME
MNVDKNLETSKVYHLSEDFHSTVPKNRQELLKWNGWGYKDSSFAVNKTQTIEFTGNRYSIGSNLLPLFTEWVKNVFKIDLNDIKEEKDLPMIFPYPMISNKFVSEIKKFGISYSLHGIDRLIRAHGHSLREIADLKMGKITKIPDIVVWPKCHHDVVQIVRSCLDNNVVCIAFGGGTSVSGAANCPIHETRSILCLDSSLMNRILWIDADNLLACCEAGIIGQDLERELKKNNFTSGHEPDSYEFSSFGGWVATKASGMKKNIYGNIEDLVIKIRMVTGRKEKLEMTLEQNSQSPRISCGPDFKHLIIGSEGTLGIITEIIFKIRPIPAVTKYGSIIFPDFEKGVDALREVAKERCQPASIRLMDNEQFKFGQTLQPVMNWKSSILNSIKHSYISYIKQFKWEDLCVATLLFEAKTESDINTQELKITKISKCFGGIPAGESNGKRGYVLTFVIAYIRDLGLKYQILAESFETSVPWNRASALCQNVKTKVKNKCHEYGINHFLISCRLTQTYDSGCCIYFYMGFNCKMIENPIYIYEVIEESAREEILASGGSISHHHGIGKMRAKFYPNTVGKTGLQLYKAMKNYLDPSNVFAVGNIDSRSVSKL